MIQPLSSPLTNKSKEKTHPFGWAVGSPTGVNFCRWGATADLATLAQETRDRLFSSRKRTVRFGLAVCAETQKGSAVIHNAVICGGDLHASIVPYDSADVKPLGRKNPKEKTPACAGVRVSELCLKDL
jgi:hypothetical protein